jgi:hypothetical protein
MSPFGLQPLGLWHVPATFGGVMLHVAFLPLPGSGPATPGRGSGAVPRLDQLG